MTMLWTSNSLNSDFKVFRERHTPSLWRILCNCQLTCSEMSRTKFFCNKDFLFETLTTAFHTMMFTKEILNIRFSVQQMSHLGVPRSSKFVRIRSLPDKCHGLQVHAVYGSKDTSRLPNLAVFKSIFPRFMSTIIQGGGHPAYLHDPVLFNSLLIGVAQNISSSPLLPGPGGSSAKDEAVGESVTSEVANTATTAKDVVYKESSFTGPEIHPLLSSHWMIAVVVGMTCVGLAAVFRVL
jgi:hypothetical protein